MKIVPSRTTTGRVRTPPRSNNTDTVIPLVKLRETNPTTTTSVVATTRLTRATASSPHGLPAAINPSPRQTPETDSPLRPTTVPPLPTLKTIKNITSLITRVNVVSNNRLRRKMSPLTRFRSLEATDRTTAIAMAVAVQIGTAPLRKSTR